MQCELRDRVFNCWCCCAFVGVWYLDIAGKLMQCALVICSLMFVWLPVVVVVRV